MPGYCIGPQVSPVRSNLKHTPCLIDTASNYKGNMRVSASQSNYQALPAHASRAASMFPAGQEVSASPIKP